MATHDVPGANPLNHDELDVGCWAEADAGDSLILVIGREDDQVIYQIYDLRSQPAMFYPDSMMKADFEKTFSKTDWLWHDKTSFPWNKVMKGVGRPRPQAADWVQDVKTAAQRIASALGLRAQRLTAADVSAQAGDAGAVIDRIAQAIKEGLGADAR